MGRRRGWRRVGSRRRFRYLDDKGNAVTSDEVLDRIASLAIPPAWRDVWIAGAASADLQATGIDAAGRRQYLYHPAYRARREREKFERLVRFGERLPAFRARVAADTGGDPLSADWVAAIAATLVNRAWFRVGSEQYARRSRTYGVTTLRKGHVTVTRGRVRLTFRAKHRQLVRSTLVDGELAAAVRVLLRQPGGSRLFRYRVEEALFPLRARHLNDYIGFHLGEGFTSKDFRTWGGTLVAAVGLAEHGPPASEAEAKRVLVSVMRRVGRELGNTPAVARGSYVSPAVIDQYRAGRTLEDFQPARSQRLSASERGLTQNERALLRLLRA